VMRALILTLCLVSVAGARADFDAKSASMDELLRHAQQTTGTSDVGPALALERNTDHFQAGLNRLFRAVAVRAFPNTACARLQGEEWVAFIAALMPENGASECLHALASGPYESAPRFEAAALNESARVWVNLYG